MATKLFVGNLAPETTDTDLREAFSAAGRCDKAAVVKDRVTGLSRGFGFVEMGSNEEAQSAIALLNGKELGGRAIGVSEARERSASPGGAGRGGPPRFTPSEGPPPRFRKHGGSRRGARARKRSL